MQVRSATLTLALAGLVATGVWAQPLPAPPSGVLSLTTSATVEVTKDVLQVVFSTTREGSDAQTVQGGLKLALDAALAEARKVAKPGQVDVQTGNFTLYPRTSNAGKAGPAITSWQGTAELIAQGRDIAAIAQLAGRIPTMTIARVGYLLSREAREKAEAEVTAQAIANWRAKASLMSQQFGYAGYTVREVSVASNDFQPRPAPMLMRAAGVSSAAGEALPTEAGKGEVSATVNGSAQMTK